MRSVSPPRSADGVCGGSAFSVDVGDLLEDISFDDLFSGDVPDLEVDPDMFAEFSPAEVGSNEKSKEEAGTATSRRETDGGRGEVPLGVTSASNSGIADCERDRRPATSVSQSKGSQGKRTVKVDWTPELHRRFVQAVEQLGVDKAVPSRILELIGIECLTRHNIASHLQKYRSHQRHVLVREAEAANWTQRRQLYGVKRETAPWPAPTMGFPSPAAPPLLSLGPLHVWGHPSGEIPLWPKHFLPPQPWAAPGWPPLRPFRPPLLQRGLQEGWFPNQRTQGPPCFPHPLTMTRLHGSPVMPGIPPHALYKADNPLAPVPTGQSDFHPSKETIDEAIGDVLAKPWLPLPLGLKPPSADSVVVELQRQEISNIPPSCA